MSLGRRRHRSLFKKLHPHPLLKGTEPASVVDTGLSCDESHRSTMRLVARDLVKTKCTDRVIECKNGQIRVSADCATPEAGRHFAAQVRGYSDVYYRAKKR